jgi:hypothetical protein
MQLIDVPKEVEDELEKLVDRYGIYSIVRVLGNICASDPSFRDRWTKALSNARIAREIGRQ